MTKYLVSDNYHNSSIHVLSASRMVMETVAELHRLGYGKLKLYTYRSSIGAWRHIIFAGDEFPASTNDLNEPYIMGSCPWLSEPTVHGNSIQAAARNFIKNNPKLIEAAIGNDERYVTWYKWALLISGIHGILFMCHENSAVVGKQHYSLYTYTDNIALEKQSIAGKSVYALSISFEDYVKKKEIVDCYSNATCAPILVRGGGDIEPFILITIKNIDMVSSVDFRSLYFNQLDD